MTVNFYKHHDQIVSAYKEVLDSRCNINWALFGYEKQTNDLMLIDKGEGGLDELYNEFSQSKILYAFCEAKDQSSQISRYILINWQGECAPFQRKGVCMNHFVDIKSFFKDAHVVLNARNEEDVEPSYLMLHVSKLSSRIKFERVEDSNEPTRVGTNYKRIVPQNEISQSARESFWQKQKQEEEERQKEAKEKTANLKADFSNVKQNDSDFSNQPTQNNQSNLLKKERLEEAKSLISKNSINSAKAFFEQNSSVSQITKKPEKAINIRESVLSQIGPQNENITVVKSNAHLNGNSEKSKEEEIDDVAEKVFEESIVHQKVPSNESFDEEEGANEESYSTTIAQFAQPYYHSTEQRILENIEEEQVNDDGELLSNKNETEISQGLRAKALYDYQAVDDTEISFDPDDIITHIEQIDSGWWQGLAPDGTYGLFPANYVELI